MSEKELEYQLLACEFLGLVHPIDRVAFDGMLLELGNFRIIDSEAVTGKIIERYLWKLRNFVDEFGQGVESRMARSPDKRTKLARLEAQFLDETKGHAVLHPDDFYRFNGRGDGEEKRETFSRGRAFVKDAARKELARLQRFVNFSSDFNGYCRYLDRACPSLYFRLSQDIQALVPEKNQTEHTYILSTTGTGKSELLKALALNYVQSPEYASLLILDPGGDMSRQIAQWPELISQERLLYFDPALSETHIPVINPFDVERLTRRDKGKLTGQIVSVIGSLVEGKLGGDISTSMEAALYPTVRLLIDLPNTSLADIPRVMIGDARLIALGSQSQDEDVADFFQNHFDNVNKMTKQSITQKINSILSKGEVRAILCGRNSIDLRHALNNQMVVVANLAKGALDFEESRVIGMLLVALAQSIGMERVKQAEHKRPRTHMIIDECQNFVTGELKDIIRETRKFGLFVSLAQQELGAEMPQQLRNAVIKTTNVKIAGRSDMTETKQTSDLVGVSPTEIAQCGRGHFFYRASNKPPFKLRVRSDRVKAKGCVDLRTWDKIKEQQLKKYYRPIRGDASQQSHDEPGAPPSPSPSNSTFDFE